MCRRFTISCFYGPPVSHLQCFLLSCIDHRFNTDYKAFLHFWSGSGFAPVRNFRLFMKFSPEPVPHQFPYNGISAAFSFALNCMRDVSNPVSGYCHLNSLFKRSPGTVSYTHLTLRRRG